MLQVESVGQAVSSAPVSINGVSVRVPAATVATNAAVSVADSRPMLLEDETGILLRYAVQTDQEVVQLHLSTLDNSLIEAGGEYEAVSVADTISSLSEREFLEIGYMSRLAVLFPYCTLKQYVFVWIETRGAVTDATALTRINRAIFPSLEIVDSDYREWVRARPRRLQAQRERLQQLDSAAQRLLSFDLLAWQSGQGRVSTSPFQVQEVKVSLAVSLTNGEGLYEVFDSIKPSREIPFTVLHLGTRAIAKVYSHIVPAQSWIDAVREKVYGKEPTTGIFFYILHSELQYAERINRIMEGNNSASFFERESLAAERHYSRATWTAENRVEMTVAVQNLETVDTMIGRLALSLRGINYKIIARDYLQAKGYAYMFGTEFDIVTFGDAVLNDPTFRNYCYFDEVSAPLAKAFLSKGQDEEEATTTKHKPICLFSWLPPGVKTRSTSSSIKLDDTDPERMTISIVRASSFNSAAVILNVFSVLFIRYMSMREELLDIYHEAFRYAPAKKARRARAVTASAEDIDTGEELGQGQGKKNVGTTLALLKYYRPQLFVTGYPSKCGKEKQPFLATGAKAARRMQMFVQRYISQGYSPTEAAELARHKIIEFPPNRGDWYYCEPRAAGEKKDTFIWPGLQVHSNLSNSTVYPLLPCCFEADQTGKESGALFQLEHPEEATGKKTSRRMLLGKKPVSLGRLGFVPFYIRQMGLAAGIGGDQVVTEETTVDSAENILARVSMPRSPDSFLRCIMYSLGTYDPLVDGDDVVAAERLRLATIAQGKISPLKQTLYDYSKAEILSLLREPASYIDPDAFLPFFEECYSISIFCFQVTATAEAGEWVVPRHHPLSAHLYTPKQERECVMVIKYETAGDSNDLAAVQERDLAPFQCEAIVRLTHETVAPKQGKGRGRTKAVNRVEVRTRVFGTVAGTTLLPTVLSQGFELANKTRQIFSIADTQLQVVSSNYSALYRSVNPVASHINEYGNIDTVWVSVEGVQLPVFTLPLPAKLLANKRWNGQLWSLHQLHSWTDTTPGRTTLALDASPAQQRQGTMRGVWLAVGGVPVYLPTRILPQLGEYPLVDNDPRRVLTTSRLVQFQQSKTVAKYLQQYALFLYSFYNRFRQPIVPPARGEYEQEVQAERISAPPAVGNTPLSVDEFIARYTVVDTGYVYDTSTKLLSINNPNYRDGRLILSSSTMGSKIASMLRVALVNDRASVMLYYTRQIVKLDYSRMADYREYSNQLLFLSLYALEQWSLRRKSSLYAGPFIVWSWLPRGGEEPFFHEPKALGYRLSLMQPVLSDSLYRATVSAYTWQSAGYNPGFFPTQQLPTTALPTVYQPNGQAQGSGGLAVLEREPGVYIAMLPLGLTTEPLPVVTAVEPLEIRESEKERE